MMAPMFRPMREAAVASAPWGMGRWEACEHEAQRPFACSVYQLTAAKGGTGSALLVEMMTISSWREGAQAGKQSPQKEWAHPVLPQRACRELMSCRRRRQLGIRSSAMETQRKMRCSSEVSTMHSLARWRSACAREGVQGYSAVHLWFTTPSRGREKGGTAQGSGIMLHARGTLHRVRLHAVQPSPLCGAG